MRYALFNQPAVTIYDQPQTVGRGPGGPAVFSPSGTRACTAQSCRCWQRTQTSCWRRCAPFYGYPGYVRRFELNEITEKELRAYLAAPAVMAARSADLLDSPRVDGLLLQTVGRGARLRLAPLPDGEETPAGWTRVLLVDGRRPGCGNSPWSRCAGRRTPSLPSGRACPLTTPWPRPWGPSPGSWCAAPWTAGTGAARKPSAGAVCETARKYLGVQYRWGGKAWDGVDCSGLVSDVYMQNGVLIYRNARITLR